MAADLGTFEIDADKISAVLVNLLTNAIKFTPDQGQIELSAKLDGDGDATATKPGFASPTAASVSSRRPSSICSSRSSPSSIPADIPQATSVFASEGSAWA